MPRLIDADNLDFTIPENPHYMTPILVQVLKNALDKAPTIEAEPVRHGYWDDSGKYTYPDGSIAIQCSECGCDLEEHEYKEYWWHYCPVCGAKMDGKDNDV